MESKRILAFDGLRCIACLLVLASHVDVLSQGGFANRVFFVLSGFLCVRYMHENVFCSLKEIFYYYSKKLIRIIPSFWLIVFAVQLFTNRFSGQELIYNLFFIKSTGIWWFLQHTMMFYLFVPIIHIAIMMLKKLFIYVKIGNENLLSILISICLFSAAFYFSYNPLFYLYGNDKYTAFCLDMFLIGMGFRYIYEAIRNSKYEIKKMGVLVLDFIEITLISLFLFTSCDVLQYIIGPQYSDYYIGWERPYLCAVISGLLILTLAINKNGYIAKILSNKYLVAVGEVSLLMYLSHAFMIPYIQLSNKYLIFIYLFIECFSISYIVYNVYEKHIVAKLNLLLKKYWCKE